MMSGEYKKPRFLLFQCQYPQLLSLISQSTFIFTRTLNYHLPKIIMSNNCGCHQNGSNGAAQEKDYSKMQALTAILNPQTVGRPKKEPKVLLYQSLPNGTLGYEQAVFSSSQQVKSQGYGQGVVGNYESPSPLTPVLRFGSNLVSLVIDDIVGASFFFPVFPNRKTNTRLNRFTCTVSALIPTPSAF
jgi:hypothetical protein